MYIYSYYLHYLASSRLTTLLPFYSIFIIFCKYNIESFLFLYHFSLFLKYSSILLLLLFYWYQLLIVDFYHIVNSHCSQSYYCIHFNIHIKFPLQKKHIRFLLYRVKDESKFIILVKKFTIDVSQLWPYCQWINLQCKIGNWKYH